MKTILFIIAMVLIVIESKSQNIHLKSGEYIYATIKTVDDSAITIRRDFQEETERISLSDVKSFSYKGIDYTKKDIALMKDKINGINLIGEDAGNELIKASGIFYTGVVISMAGLAGSVVLPRIYDPVENDDQKELKHKSDMRNKILYISGGVSLIGGIIQCASFTHINKAGNKLKIVFSPNSLGLRLKL